ncbi:MAG: class I SAM-dependent methyltransferase [Chitinophagales bacterium]|nr:class I SAM-dependent methyltransferase [Chitinophagales bacterium]
MWFRYLDYLFRCICQRSSASAWPPAIRHQIFDDRHFYAFEPIEQLRHQLLNDHRPIEAEGWGAGSRVPGRKMTVAKVARTSLLPPRYARLLFRLCLHYRCERVLELGTSLGLTTLYLAAVRSGIRIVTVEGNPQLAALASEHFRMMKTENIHMINGTFSEVLPGVLQSFVPDLVFMDGDHRSERLLDYYHLMLPHLDPRAILVVDDINWSADMQQAWKMLSAHDAVKQSVDLFRMGWLFFQPQASGRKHVTFYY